MLPKISYAEMAAELESARASVYPRPFIPSVGPPLQIPHTFGPANWTDARRLEALKAGRKAIELILNRAWMPEAADTKLAALIGETAARHLSEASDHITRTLVRKFRDAAYDLPITEFTTTYEALMVSAKQMLIHGAHFINRYQPTLKLPSMRPNIRIMPSRIYLPIYSKCAQHRTSPRYCSVMASDFRTILHRQLP
jgi:hypothetical protein